MKTKQEVRVGYSNLKKLARAAGYGLAKAVYHPGPEGGDGTIEVTVGEDVVWVKEPGVKVEDHYHLLYPEVAKTHELEDNQPILVLTNLADPQYPGLWCVDEVEKGEDFQLFLSQADHNFTDNLVTKIRNSYQDDKSRELLDQDHELEGLKLVSVKHIGGVVTFEVKDTVCGMVYIANAPMDTDGEYKRLRVHEILEKRGDRMVLCSYSAFRPVLGFLRKVAGVKV